MLETALQLDDDGVVSGAVFSDTNGTAAALTARVALLDGASQTLGETFIFEDADSQFLFIQGGSTGTADDLVVQFGSGAPLGVGNTLSFASGKISFGHA